ncbi:FG-GAP repeat domain-containing protein [Flavihumibacter petaseus]|nr:FG-GAP and VCBS repeat-containing protein [Flavihumibacter petaseus]
MRSNRKVVWIVTAIAGIIVLGWWLFQQTGQGENQLSANAGHAAHSQGKSAAVRYCQSCHLLPEPELLDKKTWTTFLPEMGLYLGIHSAGVAAIEAADKDFYPEHPVVTEQEWQEILSYYTTSAPSALPELPHPLPEAVTGFNLLPPPDFLFRPNVMASLVKIDNTVSPARLFVFDAFSNQLFLFGQEGLLDSLKVNGIVVDLQGAGNHWYACSIGDYLQMGPDKDKKGSIIPISLSPKGKLQQHAPLIKDLARPVRIVVTAANKDGQPDFLVCEFGKLTGSLTLLESNEKSWRKKAIRPLPGAVTAFFEKNPATGREDIWALFAQGDECIIHFENRGDGTYDEHKVLRFPPSYGSSSFSLTDLDGDGNKDILYTCGDNGDATRIYKPYHGIYVFRQEAPDRFAEKFFYPLNGAYKAIAGDFRQKGRTDIAAVGYFTDPSHPADWFVYLNHLGNLGYSANAAPDGFNLEAALTMDSGDFNGDGQPDLLIGNAFLKNDPRQSAPLFGLMESIAR